jgi:hypothetical protein
LAWLLLWKLKENEMEDEWWKQVEIGSERVAGQGDRSVFEETKQRDRQTTTHKTTENHHHHGVPPNQHHISGTLPNRRGQNIIKSIVEFSISIITNYICTCSFIDHHTSLNMSRAILKG